MKIKNPIYILLLSWLSSALAIIGIAFIIAPDTYIDGFWCRVAWTEFLNILFWVANFGWFTDNKDNTNTALTPSNNFITYIYCIFSFIVMISFYYYETTNGFSKIHGVIQVAFFCLYALIILRLQLASYFADKNLVVTKETGVSVSVLAQKIKNVETDYSDDLEKEIKKLREKIIYSLQDNNKTRTNKLYKQVAEEILENLDKFTSSNIKKFINRIEDIKQETKRL